MRCACVMMAAFLVVLPPTLDAQERFGGIEIGSKGVKWVYVETRDGNAKEIKEQKVKAQDTTDVGLVAANFSPEAIEYAVQAVHDAQEKLSDVNVPKENILVVASSGVIGAASKNKDKPLETLASKIPGLRRLDAYEEVRLLFNGIVPKNDRRNSIMIDIGSGNTKFGLLDEHGELRTGEISMASGTVAKEFLEIIKTKDQDEALKTLQEKFAGSLKNEIENRLSGQIERIRKSDRLNVYLSGGIIWAMATFEQPSDFLKPTDIENPRVKIDLASVEEFRKRVMQDEITFAASDSSFLQDERKRIQEIFPQNSLRAGTVLLNGLKEGFELTEKDDVYFDRNSLFAWIRGYVVEELEKRSPKKEDVSLFLPDEVRSLTKTLGEGFKEIGAALKSNQRNANTPIKIELTTNVMDGVIQEIKNLKEAVEKRPISVAPVESVMTPVRQRLRSEDGWTLLHLGREEYWSQHYEEALKAFREATTLAPDEPIIWYYRALAEVATDQSLEAEASAIRCAQLLRTDKQFVELCRQLERVQGCPRQLIDSLVKRGQLSLKGVPTNSN